MAEKLKGGQVSLQPCDARRERERLEKWLRAPHVAKWWGEPEKAVAEVLMPPRGGGEALITVDGAPVGYIRWQVPSREELEAAGLGDMPDSAIDIDIAIGEPAYVGRGVAAEALRLLVRQLCASPPVPPLIMLCPSVANASAVRAFERAGFERERVFDDPEYGRMWLLVMRPAPEAAQAHPQ